VVVWKRGARARDDATRASNVGGEKRGKMARLTLVDGLEALLVVVDPVGLHELELPALVRVPGRRHRCESARLQCDRKPGREVRRKRRECDTHNRRREGGGAAAYLRQEVAEAGERGRRTWGRRKRRREGRETERKWLSRQG